MKMYTRCLTSDLRCYLLVILMSIDLGCHPTSGEEVDNLTHKERVNKLGQVSKKRILYEKTEPDSDEEHSRNQTEGGSLLNDIYIRSTANLNSQNGNSSSSGDGLRRRYLKCWSCEPNCENLYTCDTAFKCYKARIRDSVGIERLSKGCVGDTEHGQLMCKSPNHQSMSRKAHNETKPDYNHLVYRIIECCSEGDYCNAGNFPPPPELIEHRSDDEHLTQTDLENDLSNFTIGYIALAIIIFVVSVIGFYALINFIRKRRIPKTDLTHSHRDNFYPLAEEQLRAKPAGDSTLKEYIDGSMTSGSGSGLPFLIQRTLAKNVQLLECIGKGRYGEVWLATWNCENVAVKITSTRDEASWVRETEIYTTVMMRHENVLGFYGSDMISKNSVTQLWLVTQYHRQGSLYDFLNTNAISEQQLLKFAYSIANGLAFLHSEMVGTESRAGIAHRDIKSKNILVTNSDVCVIADFGLAVTHKRDTGELNVYPNPKVGTRRYMAPEILDDSMNVKSFDAYKRADMYAFALVLWEMCRRTAYEGVSEEYQPPFYDVVPGDPSFEDMRKVVCIDGYRPVIPDNWSTDPVLSCITRLIKECWHPNAAVRLSALRVKKSIALNAQDKFKGLLDAAFVYS